MAKRHRERQIHLEYTYDRLGDYKISEVYRLLVPEIIRACVRGDPNVGDTGDRESEDSSDLCKSINREAKRTTNHR